MSWVTVVVVLTDLLMDWMKFMRSQNFGSMDCPLTELGKSMRGADFLGSCGG